MSSITRGRGHAASRCALDRAPLAGPVCLLRRIAGTALLVVLPATLSACGTPSTPPPVTSSSASAAPDPGPPARKHTKGENPFTGAKWWVDPYGQAHLRSLRAQKTDPDLSALLDKIARNGGADWIGEWTPNVENWVRKRVALLEKNGDLPFFVAYDIPQRDCGLYSRGGAAGGKQYREWIAKFARGIGNHKAVVILEPDALPSLTKCLSPDDQQLRTELVKFAVHAFESNPLTWVYIDAGHSAWIPAAEMAPRLKAAGLDEADGFSLNVSNYRSTPDLLAFGKKLSALVGGAHFVIDTGRNGNGSADAPIDSEASWCNPPGRALGKPPTTDTGEPLCDAFLWIKKPGESDGECGGGPKAGVWWQERAIELAQKAKW
jgi:endoglucanase